jgi:hypothetical protein
LWQIEIATFVELGIRAAPWNSDDGRTIQSGGLLVRKLIRLFIRRAAKPTRPASAKQAVSSQNLPVVVARLPGNASRFFQSRPVRGNAA